MKHQCQRPKCRYEWESDNPNPKSCPRCKSYKWNEPHIVIGYALEDSKQLPGGKHHIVKAMIHVPDEVKQ